MKAMNFRDSDSGSTSGEEVEQDSSRLDNLHWCTCLHCTVIPTLVESKFCKEYSELLRDKLDGVNCIYITQESDFVVNVFASICSGTAFIRHRRYKNNFTDVKKLTLK